MRRRSFAGWMLMLGRMVVAGCFWSLAGFASPAPPNAGKDAVACAVATSYARDFLASSDKDRPTVFDSEVPQADSSDSVWDLRNHGWDRDPPSLALAMAFVATNPRGALSTCPDLRSLLTRAGVAFGRAVVEARIKSAPINNYAVTIVSLALPVVRSDGREALMSVSYVSGSLAGHGATLHLRRRGAEPWRVVDVKNGWIA